MLASQRDELKDELSAGTQEERVGQGTQNSGQRDANEGRARPQVRVSLGGSGSRLCGWRDEGGGEGEEVRAGGARGRAQKLGFYPK